MQYHDVDDKTPIRFNIIDDAGTISFAGPGHGMKVLAAACSAGATTSRELLATAATFDAEMIRRITDGLSIWDEHCLPGEPETVDRWLEGRDLGVGEPFRVVNDVTRRASLLPRRLGLVIFNLPARRIVQVENRYGQLLREDRGRIREQGKPVRKFYTYELPQEWAIVP